MSKLGGFNAKGLKSFQKKLQKLQSSDLDAFCRQCAYELANRLLSQTVKRTPVGKYKNPNKQGGTLRRGWTLGEIRKENEAYIIEIINPVMYASYVEYGHRTANHKGWVTGRFMLTMSAEDVEKLAPQLLEKRLKELLQGCFK